MNDRRRLMPPVDFDFNRSLKSFQSAGVAEMAKKDFGTLSAPTGSGKTVMGLYLIAQRRQPTVVVVHTKELAFSGSGASNSFWHPFGPGRIDRRRKKKNR